MTDEIEEVAVELVETTALAARSDLSVEERERRAAERAAYDQREKRRTAMDFAMRRHYSSRKSTEEVVRDAQKIFEWLNEGKT